MLVKSSAQWARQSWATVYRFFQTLVSDSRGQTSIDSWESMRDLYDPTGTEVTEQVETEETHMFVAQLSALDLGAWVQVYGVKKGSKYANYYGGTLTEVQHANEGTKIRLISWHGRYTAKDAKERAVRNKSGDMMTFPHGLEVKEYVDP